MSPADHPDRGRGSRFPCNARLRLGIQFLDIGGFRQLFSCSEKKHLPRLVDLIPDGTTEDLMTNFNAGISGIEDAGPIAALPKGVRLC